MKRPNDVSAMVRLKACGWGVKRIARELGCSHHTLKQYVGLDVSLAETSIVSIDDNDKILWRGSTPSTPDAIAEVLRKHAAHAERVGIEADQLSAWLYHGLKAKGWPIVCIDARHAKAALSLRLNKADTSDALGIAQIMRVGWYREATVKGHDCQALRALLVARRRLSPIPTQRFFSSSTAVVPDFPMPHDLIFADSGVL